jgi:hypothetical protein
MEISTARGGGAVMIRCGALGVTCSMQEFCLTVGLSAAEQVVSSLAGFCIQLDIPYYTLLNIYMTCTSFMVCVLR